MTVKKKKKCVSLTWFSRNCISVIYVKAITFVCCLKMKRDAWVKCCLFIIKRQHFTQVSLFILGWRTDVTVLVEITLAEIMFSNHVSEIIFWNHDSENHFSWNQVSGIHISGNQLRGNHITGELPVNQRASVCVIGNDCLTQVFQMMYRVSLMRQLIEHFERELCQYGLDVNQMNRCLSLEPKSYPICNCFFIAMLLNRQGSNPLNYQNVY